ncbi:MAG: hypothetical protein GWN01_07835 [Nitrosopumilaceae archaeon]|nr:hypothetical protein [Nitrosopumilaceae archaeon]NIU00830.1 hypothetical protein [Nitrosopumilaceae archaeon]NIU87283.1 hypothetical protein [Nitrosopumilaceae archaeon]NIV65811.1 hypothetical protein [Nitrosopumilaceae archaeon]NIX61432.1 hypothetical protein [Nitrosopumilaceae archaeon]
MVIPSSALAQEISFGEKAEHVFVEVSISQGGEVHVQHKIKPSKTAVEVKTIPGEVSNIEVLNEDEKAAQHAVSGDNRSIVVFPSDSHVYVDYDLGNVLQVDDHVWKWDFRYLESTNFVFPQSVDLVFVDDRPVMIGEQRGIKCHGCEMVLEYVIDEPVIKKDVEWKQEKFAVFIRTLSQIDGFSFNQPSKTLSFEVKDPNEFVTVLLPLDLLWNPYEVFLEDEKILDHEYIRNDTHIWLNVKPKSPGTLEIIGTSVVPEFPILLPILGISVAAVIGLQLKYRINLH